MVKRFFWIMLVMTLTLGLVLSSCTTFDSLSRENLGNFQTIRVPDKDFQSLGLVFTEVSFADDDKGQRGDVFTYYSLLQEAKKLGADYIINVVTDVKREGSRELLFKKDIRIIRGKETWYGSATAIKYTDTIHTVESVLVTDKSTTVTRDSVNSTGSSIPTVGDTAESESVRRWYKPSTWTK